ncbi:MAG: hypothetical protein IPK19_17935 [Chloroflexi bacterium]|nr:hypothetical protein [Chloroflexota bacterium]
MAAPETLIGIVAGPDEDSLTIGVVDLARKRTQTDIFRLKKAPFDELMAMNGSSLPTDLRAVKSFLDQHITRPDTTRVLMEVPPQPQPADNRFFRVLFGLTLSQYIYFAMGVSQDKQQTIIHFAMPVQAPPNTPAAKHEEMRQRQVLTLTPRLGETYAHWLCSASPSPETGALGAALIGANMTLYHYLMIYPYGNEPSSGDLVAFFTMGEMMQQATRGKDVKMASAWIPQSVLVQSRGGKQEMITWSATERLKMDERDQIPMEYATAAKRYDYLGAMNSQKFGAMSVCRRWGMNLHYSFTEAENPLGAAALPRLAVVDPLHPPEEWILSGLRAAAGSGDLFGGPTPAESPAVAAQWPTPPTPPKPASQPTSQPTSLVDRLLSRFRKK